MLDELITLANRLEPTDDPDELGKLDHLIRTLNKLKRISLDELPGPVSGSDYRVTEQNSAKRSYNTARLVDAFAREGYTLRDLMTLDAVRLSWHWTELRRAATKYNVTLEIAAHEVEDEGDLDEAMIGEVWSTRYAIEGTE